MIRAGISKSEGFARLSPDAQVLFCMLIPHFNAYGKMNGNPHFIKGEVVPLIERFDAKKIGRCLSEISDKTGVKWFMVRGIHYLHSLSFGDHQDIRTDRRGHDDMPSFQDYSGSCPGLVRPEVEVEVQGEVEVQKNHSDQSSPKPGEMWDRFWTSYPRKTAKQKALQAWKKISPDPALAETILTALEKQKSSPQWLKDGGQFVPHPATWLNGRRWEDEVVGGQSDPLPGEPGYVTRDVDRLIGHYRDLKGIPRNDKEFRTVIWPGMKRDAQKVLDYFEGGLETAGACLAHTAEKCKGFEWGWSAVLKRAPEFKAGARD